MAISLDAYLMGRKEKYPNEYSQEIEDNAKILLKKVNSFLSELGVISVLVSSGWRPPSVNSKVPGSAKRSLHMSGKAIDLVDKTGQLKQQILNKEEWLKEHDQPSLLKKYDLWMEHPESTNGWCHLDIGNRSDRPLRVFKP